MKERRKTEKVKIRNVRREIEKIEAGFERRKRLNYTNELVEIELAKMKNEKQKEKNKNPLFNAYKSNKILPYDVNDFVTTATLEELELAWQLKEDVFTTKLCCAIVLSSIRFRKGIDVSQKLPLSLMENESISKLDMDAGIEMNAISDEIESSKVKRIAEVTTRKKQSEFRSLLLKSYGACAITGSKISQILEAAHVVPFNGFNDHLDNGILLRTDMHKLFDCFLISIHPITKELQLNKIVEGEYGKYKKNMHVTVSDANLNWHYTEFKKLNSTSNEV